MTLEIVEAGKKLKPVVQNLGLYYLYDFTELLDIRCPDSGLFRTSHWDKYWAEAGRWAFLVKIDGQPAGFVLVSTEGTQPGTEFSIDDFFITRKFRRRGFGQRVAFSILDRFRGRWEIREVVQNGPAIAFWRKVIRRYTDGRYSELPEPVRHGQWLCLVQTFDNSKAGPKAAPP